jgi:hypothetical protein
MHSTMIGKIEKARRYAEEQNQRIVFHAFEVSLEGDHRNHRVAYNHGTWRCDCETFDHNQYCPHTMALERVLGQMLTPAPQLAPAPELVTAP